MRSTIFAVLKSDLNKVADRLTEIVNSSLDDQYFFQTVDSDPHYGCMFGKLRKNGTRAVDRISYGSPQHGGIFIDVFPIDAKAYRPLARVEQHLMRNVGFRFLYLKSGYLFMRGTSLPSRVAQAIVRAIGWITPRRVILALMNRHTHLGETTTPRSYGGGTTRYATTRTVAPARRKSNPAARSRRRGPPNCSTAARAAACISRRWRNSKPRSRM